MGMVVMVGSPSFLCEQTGMAGCAMVRAVADGADSACGVVVVSAGSSQHLSTTSTTKEDKRSMVASSVAASATRKRNDGFTHGKPLVMRIC